MRGASQRAPRVETWKPQVFAHPPPIIAGSLDAESRHQRSTTTVRLPDVLEHVTVRCQECRVELTCDDEPIVHNPTPVALIGNAA
jgi:hypothetical protein